MAGRVYLHHPSSLEHDTGAHPERIARISAIERELEARGWLGFERVLAPAATLEQLHLVHPPGHVELIAAIAERGGGAIDADTLLSAGSYGAALHAAGGGVAMVDRLLSGEAEAGFCGLRPPGHHAEPGRAMGFCLFNNVAVAARHALAAYGCERVLILDWDVHHGNGTNAVFHDSAEVLFASIHQSPLFPGTGPAADVGSGPGTGYTVNMPVPAGSGDETFCSLVEHVVLPLGRAFAPRLVLISAGYDAHRDDPLADCEVTDAGFAVMAASMRRLCGELGVPMGMVLEGGYDLAALSRGVASTLEAVGADPPATPPAPPLHPLAADALARLASRWPALGGARAAG